MECAIHVIHENTEWSAPLFAELTARGLPFEDWYLDAGGLDLSAPPPEGVFYNRMSASAHTRGHRYSPEYAGAVLAWLDGHDRRVINDSRALRLEISKVAQYMALGRHGIRVPKTIAAVGCRAIREAAAAFDGPFITKHNRAGKGLGVHLFETPGELDGYLASSEFEPPVDGITLVQHYIRAPEPFITRVEFVGGELLYAVRVDTSEGFELCPADVCALPDGPRETFEIIPDFESPLVEKYRAFLADNGIAVAGIEFIEDADGTLFTYDVNTNTNYNPPAESKAGVSAMAAIARYLGEELARQSCAEYWREAMAGS